MKKILLLVFVTATFVSQGQVSKSITNADSTHLNSFFKSFTKEIELKSAKEIRRMSLRMIDCSLCLNQDTPPPEDYLVSVDTFINQIFANKYSRLLKAITEQAPIYNLYSNTNILKQEELKGQKNVKIYELFFVTVKPNEFEHGHEGQSIALQFIKLKDGFRFYGLTSVP